MLLVGNLHRKIGDQVDYLLSRDNLEEDKYLEGSIDESGFVKIADLVTHIRIKNFCKCSSVLAKVLQERPEKFQVSKDGTRVRLRDSLAKCYLVLRGPPQETPVAEVKNLFNPEISAGIARIEFVYQNVWYVYFYEDGLARQAIQYVCELVPHFKGNVVTARVKTMQSVKLPSDSKTTTATTISQICHPNFDYSGFYSDEYSVAEENTSQDSTHGSFLLNSNFLRPKESDVYGRYNQYDLYEDPTRYEAFAMFNNSVENEFDNMQGASLLATDFNLDITKNTVSDNIPMTHNFESFNFPSFDLQKFSIPTINLSNDLQAPMPVNSIRYLPYQAPVPFPVPEPSHPVNPVPISSDNFLQTPYLATNIAEVVDFAPTSAMISPQLVSLVSVPPSPEFQVSFTFPFDAECAPFKPSGKQLEHENMQSIFSTPPCFSGIKEPCINRSKTNMNKLHDDVQFETTNQSNELSRNRPNCKQFNFNPKMPSSKKNSKLCPWPRPTKIMNKPQYYSLPFDSPPSQEFSNIQNSNPKTLPLQVDRGINSPWSGKQKSSNDFQNHSNLLYNNCSDLRPTDRKQLLLPQREAVDEHVKNGVNKNVEMSLSNNYSCNYSSSFGLEKCPQYPTTLAINDTENGQVAVAKRMPLVSDGGYSFGEIFSSWKARTKLQTNSDGLGSGDELLQTINDGLGSGDELLQTINDDKESGEQFLQTKNDENRSGHQLLQIRNDVNRSGDQMLQIKNDENRSGDQLLQIKNDEHRSGDQLLKSMETLTLKNCDPSRDRIFTMPNFLGPRKTYSSLRNTPIKLEPDSVTKNSAFQVRVPSTREKSKFLCDNCRRSMNPARESKINTKVKFKTISMIERQQTISNSGKLSPINEEKDSSLGTYSKHKVLAPAKRERTPENCTIVDITTTAENTNLNGCSPAANQDLGEYSSSVDLSCLPSENCKAYLSNPGDFQDNVKWAEVSSDSKTKVKDLVHLSYAAVARTFYPTKIVLQQEEETGNCKLKSERPAPAIIVSRSVAKGFLKSFEPNRESRRDEQDGLKRP